MLSLRPQVPQTHPPQDRTRSLDRLGSADVDRLGQAEEHDDEHGEVADGGEVVAPPEADELAEELRHKERSC
jgi:hypothetical protein